MSGLSVRRARARDVVRYTKFCLPKFIGVVAELDGQPIGAAFALWDHGKRPFLCFENTETLRRHPVFLHKTAKAIIQSAIAELGELYTIESADEPTAPKWLARLGFVPTGETIENERVLKWQPLSHS